MCLLKYPGEVKGENLLLEPGPVESFPAVDTDVNIWQLQDLENTPRSASRAITATFPDP